ncbi:T9SS type A sorting domain-containing protein, partial [Hyunsoonleella sp. SJ7]
EEFICSSTAPAGYADNNTDCDDTDASVNTPQLYYVDFDGDGFGSTAEEFICSSTAPAGYADNNTDCDDTDASVNTPQLYYVDFDGDGFGSTAEEFICSSTVPAGYADNNTDCDDADPNVNPGVSEIVGNGIDDDCDPSTLDMITYVWAGNVDSDWTDSNNWESGLAPGLSPAYEILIPSGRPNYPVLTSGQNLDLASSASIEVDTGASLMVLPNVVVTNNGVITNNGVFALKSDATGSAYIGSGTGTFNGVIDVERYIPSRRAFRLLSTPVTTSDFISNNWQQGTHITGSVSGANGFDATVTGNPSMYTFDNFGQTWDAIPSTDATNLVTGTPYRLMVRGDRTIDLNDNNAVPTATTLVSKGILEAENATPGPLALNNISGGFSFVGNPFQAQVDMNALLTFGSSNVSTLFYWVWDASLGIRGAYATVIVPTGQATAGVSNEFLQAGQACFVRTLNDGPASITFSQSSKHTSSPETQIFKRGTGKSTIGQLSLSLYERDAYKNGEPPSDGLLILFNENGNNEVDGLDATKFTNLDENLAVDNEGSLLSIENRMHPTGLDEIQLFVDSYRGKSYTLRINSKGIEGAVPILLDTYTNMSVRLDQGPDINYNFDVDPSIGESISAHRFKIIFDSKSLSIQSGDIWDVEMYPNPTDVGYFSLNVPQGADDLEITIYNVLGAKVFHKDNFTPGKKTIISTGFTKNNDNGVYLVKMESKDRVVTKKLIIN